MTFSFTTPVCLILKRLTLSKNIKSDYYDTKNSTKLVKSFKVSISNQDYTTSKMQFIEELSSVLLMSIKINKFALSGLKFFRHEQIFYISSQ